MRLIFSKYSTVILTLIFLTLFAVGCRREADPALIRADALMEEHPDSALNLLNLYRLTDDTPAHDRAIHGMLLTHARYKNFIDETDDSLINASVEYFLSHDMIEEAARSFFLQGVIQRNAGSRGKAAVSLSKGLEIARKHKLYMWQGQCARIMFFLYGDMMDASAQLKYAKEEKEAFLKGGYEDWMQYARLSLSHAYNNNGQFDEALIESTELLKTLNEETDTKIIAETLELMASANFSLGNDMASLENFAKAHVLDSCVMSDNDRFNVSVIVSRIDMDSVPAHIKNFIKSIRLDSHMPAFTVLAGQGKYKEAFEELEKYRLEQDSVLALILRNDVSESVLGYEDMQNRLRQARLRTVRALSVLVVVLIAVIVLAVLLWYRSRLLKKTMEFDRMEAKMESLRSDLSSYMERISVLSEKNSEMRGTLFGAVRDRYSRVDRLCDKYYQDSARRGSASLPEKEKRMRAEMHKEVRDIIKDFSDEDFLMEVEEYVDRYVDGIWTSFKEDFPTVTGDGRRLFLYAVLGFSVRTLSVILDVEKDVVYNRRSRLRSKIAASSSPRKERYLAFL